MAKWTDKEVVMLVDFYRNKTPLDIVSEKLNRSKSAVRTKAYTLGITNNEHFFTDEEKKYIRENYKSYNLREIAKTLGREKNYHNICRLAKQMGLERTGKKKEKLKPKKPNKYKNEEERNRAQSIRHKKWHKENEHPRGMLGKTHSVEYRKEISKRVKNYYANASERELLLRSWRQRQTKIKNGTLNPQANNGTPYSRARGGKRKDLNNTYFRSAWEANVARYYNYIGVKWEFEPKTFVFENIKRGSVSYTPDFYLPDEDKWIEVKGWMDSKSKTKLKRFKRYYPKEYEKLELIDQSKYKEIKKLAPFIKNWE